MTGIKRIVIKMKKHAKANRYYKYVKYAECIVYRYIIYRQWRSCKVYGNNKLSSIGSMRQSFFGYYNLSPENAAGDVAFLTVKNEKTRGSIEEKAQIVLVRKGNEETYLQETSAWNWQQGCMLQWIENGSLLLYNDYSDEKDMYLSRAIDMNGKTQKEYDKPVYSVAGNGRFALTLNFDRLTHMRPCYGYFKTKAERLPADDNDGIWKLDLISGTCELIITLDRLKTMMYSSTMLNADHKVNHIDISPSGKRFMFLHRWTGPQGRYMRLITADSSGGNIRILNGDEMTSHSCWIDDSTIVSYCNYNGTNGYFVIKDEERTNREPVFLRRISKEDGHPSLSPDSRVLLYDTYPDRARMSYLYLYDMESESLAKIGRFHQPYRYKGEMRIDLHPKWDTAGRRIYFESGHEGCRRLYAITLGNAESMEIEEAEV